MAQSFFKVPFGDRDSCVIGVSGVLGILTGFAADGPTDFAVNGPTDFAADGPTGFVVNERWPGISGVTI